MRLPWCCSAVSRALAPSVPKFSSQANGCQRTANIFNHFNTLLGNALRATSDDFYVFYLTVNKHQ